MRARNEAAKTLTDALSGEDMHAIQSAVEGSIKFYGRDALFTVGTRTVNHITSSN